jgi:hypothetical protein
MIGSAYRKASPRADSNERASLERRRRYLDGHAGIRGTQARKVPESEMTDPSPPLEKIAEKLSDPTLSASESRAMFPVSIDQV